MVNFIAVDSREALSFPEMIDIPELDYLAGKKVGDLLLSEQCATAAALARCGRPNMTLQLDTLYSENLGALIYMFEVHTIFAGALFNVDPLDQPGVEDGKDFTYALMGRPGFSAVRIDLENWFEGVERRIL